MTFPSRCAYCGTRTRFKSHWDKHIRTKKHKRKMLRFFCDEPITQSDAEFAAFLAKQATKNL